MSVPACSPVPRFSRAPRGPLASFMGLHSFRFVSATYSYTSCVGGRVGTAWASGSLGTALAPRGATAARRPCVRSCSPPRAGRVPPLGLRCRPVRLSLSVVSSPLSLSLSLSPRQPGAGGGYAPTRPRLARREHLYANTAPCGRPRVWSGPASRHPSARRVSLAPRARELSPAHKYMPEATLLRHHQARAAQRAPRR